MAHTLQLTTGGVLLLKHLLSQPNWYDGKVPLILAAGQVLELPALTAEPPKNEDEATAVVAVEVTEKQREALKACVAYWAGKSAFGPSKHVAILLGVLGLAD
jgi:hypothetical protein